MAGTNSTGAVATRELVGGADNAEYCTVYSGAMSALIAVGVAKVEQFPTTPGGTRSSGYKGFKLNPQQRWKIRRRGEDQFDVYLWHKPRPTRTVFERFMAQAMRQPT